MSTVKVRLLDLSLYFPLGTDLTALAKDLDRHNVRVTVMAPDRESRSYFLAALQLLIADSKTEPDRPGRTLNVADALKSWPYYFDTDPAEQMCPVTYRYDFGTSPRIDLPPLMGAFCTLDRRGEPAVHAEVALTPEPGDPAPMWLMHVRTMFDSMVDGLTRVEAGNPVDRGPQVEPAPIGQVRQAPPGACTAFGRFCAEHGFEHGAEAEELREGVEHIIEGVTHGDPAGPAINALRDLLNRVDARDSLAYAAHKKKGG